MNKTCRSCGLTLQGMENEGERCLECSFEPHCSFDGGYYSPDNISTIEGIIRQQTNNKLTDKEKENDE